MLNRTKKIISIFVFTAFVLLLITPTFTYASEANSPNPLTTSSTYPLSQQEQLLLFEVLFEIELNKTAWGMEKVDFSHLHIGNPIYSYNLIADKFQLNHIMYPLTVNGKILLWAIPTNGQFQVTTALTTEINKSVMLDDSIALVHDAHNTYLYLNDAFVKIKGHNQDIPNRSILAPNARYVTKDLQLTKLNSSTPLQYGINPLPSHKSAITNYSCNVTYVTQLPYQNLCWAATVACIVNYKSGTTLTARNVAERYFGTVNYNQGISPDNLTEKIKGYGLNYYRFSRGDFDAKILDSILLDNPVGASFRVINGNYHACTIFGVNPIAGRIQIMDPEFGATTAMYSSTTGYTYISNYTGTTLTLYAISYDDGT